MALRSNIVRRFNGEGQQHLTEVITTKVVQLRPELGALYRKSLNFTDNRFDIAVDLTWRNPHILHLRTEAPKCINRILGGLGQFGANGLILLPEMAEHTNPNT